MSPCRASTLILKPPVVARRPNIDYFSSQFDMFLPQCHWAKRNSHLENVIQSSRTDDSADTASNNRNILQNHTPLGI